MPPRSAFSIAPTNPPAACWNFCKILQQQEFVLVGHPNPFLINHPLTSDRIDNVQQHVDQSPYSNVPTPPAWVDQHKRMVAKLVGFLWPFQQVMPALPGERQKPLWPLCALDRLFPGRRSNHALALIDGLIAENPKDPYFPEQKGQILFENGRGAEALVAYQRALDLAPDEPLIRMELANVQIEQEDPALLKPAIDELKRSCARSRTIPAPGGSWASPSGATTRSGLLPGRWRRVRRRPVPTRRRAIVRPRR